MIVMNSLKLNSNSVLKIKKLLHVNKWIKTKILAMLTFALLFSAPSHALVLEPDFDGVAAFNILVTQFDDINGNNILDLEDGELTQIYGLGIDFDLYDELSNGQFLTLLDGNLLVVGTFFDGLILSNDFDITNTNQFLGDESSIFDARSSEVPIPAAFFLYLSACFVLVSPHKLKKIFSDCIGSKKATFA